MTHDEIRELLLAAHENEDPEAWTLARQTIAENMTAPPGAVVHTTVEPGASDWLSLGWSEILSKRQNGNDAGGGTIWRSLAVRAVPVDVSVAWSPSAVVVRKITIAGGGSLYGPGESDLDGIPTHTALMQRISAGYRADLERVSVEVTNTSAHPVVLAAVGITGDRETFAARPSRMLRWKRLKPVADGRLLEAVLTVEDLGGNAPELIEIVSRSPAGEELHTAVETTAEVFVAGADCPLADRQTFGPCVWRGPGPQCQTPSGVLVRVPVLPETEDAELLVVVETCRMTHDRY